MRSRSRSFWSASARATNAPVIDDVRVPPSAWMTSQSIQIVLDCDVIQADGGTRTASISGAWVALRIAVNKLMETKALAEDPIRTQVAAVSCGVFKGTAVLDLDYDEDSAAGCDGNFVLTADGSIVEAQVTAEGECYDEELLLRMLRLARIGCGEIFEAQLKAAGK